jgi:hypothetical protein
MTRTDQRIERLLSAIKAEERSSPAGIHWQEFYAFLMTKRQPGRKNPPVPLILAASCESDCSKHARLSSQLGWALDNDCLDEAIRYLEEIPVNQWNSCPLERWDDDSY